MLDLRLVDNFGVFSPGVPIESPLRLGGIYSEDLLGFLKQLSKSSRKQWIFKQKDAESRLDSSTRLEMILASDQVTKKLEPRPRILYGSWLAWGIPEADASARIRQDLISMRKFVEKMNKERVGD